MTSINICVATYDRNDGLIALMESLRDTVPVGGNDVTVEILIIDNNSDGRAKSVVQSFQNAEYPVPVSYCHEIRPGVSYVRNTAFKQSADKDFIAFIDDDETVTPEWLLVLWQQYQKTGAAVVFGPAIATYPVETPKWMLDGDYHSCLLEENGLRDTPGSVGNCLIELASIRRHGLSFETSISEIGGEDTLLFTEMLDLGETLADAKDAIVYEHVSSGRIKAAWLFKRWRRTGWTDAMVKYRKQSQNTAKLKALGGGILRIGSGGVLSSLWYVVSGLRMTKRVADRVYTFQRGLGMVDFARGYIIREYGHDKKS